MTLAAGMDFNRIAYVVSFRLFGIDFLFKSNGFKCFICVCVCCSLLRFEWIWYSPDVYTKCTKYALPRYTGDLKQSHNTFICFWHGFYPTDNYFAPIQFFFVFHFLYCLLLQSWYTHTHTHYSGSYPVLSFHMGILVKWIHYLCNGYTIPEIEKQFPSTSSDMENIPIKALLRINNIGIMQRHKHIWNYGKRIDWIGVQLRYCIE